MNDVKAFIDFSAPSIGKIKPLHGTNNSRVALRSTLPEFQAAGIPYIRPHDFGGAYGGTVYFDVPNIFRDFDADVDDAANYAFEFTDAYIENIYASGCKIQYRLGVTIENNYRIRAFHIDPPADFQKWAQICEHIIRHYTEGWANGFHFDIEYWEIWNEPENPPCWTGTKEQFFELYKVAATHLKKCFPKLKIGGCGFCGFYEFDPYEPQLERFKYFRQYFDDFVEFTVKENIPLDFVSWHRYYSRPTVFMRDAVYVREILDKFGLTQTESFLNEWNYCNSKKSQWDDMKEAEGASNTAHVLILLQNLPVDKAMYYDALPTRKYCGFYYYPSETVTPLYYTFFAFNRLYQLQDQLSCKVEGPAAVLAAGSKDSGAMLVVNSSSKSCDFELECKNAPSKKCTAYLTHKKATMRKIDFNGKLRLFPHSVLLLEWNRPEMKRTANSAEKNNFAGLDLLP